MKRSIRLRRNKTRHFMLMFVMFAGATSFATFGAAAYMNESWLGMATCFTIFLIMSSFGRHNMDEFFRYDRLIYRETCEEYGLRQPKDFEP